MKILYLAPSLPWPAHTGGTRRSSAILERLAQRHEVYLFALEGEGGSIEATITAGLAGVRTIAYPGSTKSFWKQLISDPLPKAVRQAISESTLREAVSFTRSCMPDALIAEPIEMYPYLESCARVAPNARTMMCWIDVVWLKIARQTARATGPAERVHAYRERTRMRRLERKAARSVDVRTCVSSIDKAALEQLSDRPFTLAPNGVDTTLFAPREGPINSRQALFVGPLSFEPNRDGVAWFSSEILPLLDGVTLTVAGEPAGFLAPTGVGLAGRVSDIRSMLARAGVVVVPLRSGSGTRLKILEALAMGKAVVTTSIGAEGLSLRDSEHLLIADEAPAFANAIMRVLNDDELRASLGRNGRALVQSTYRWDGAVDAIEQALGAKEVLA
ncbi:MAG: glycosyltransferase family 4 protein [Actinomycetota bacterium]